MLGTQLPKGIELTGICNTGSTLAECLKYLHIPKLSKDKKHEQVTKYNINWQHRRKTSTLFCFFSSQLVQTKHAARISQLPTHCPKKQHIIF
jgi:arginine repressor